MTKNKSGQTAFGAATVRLIEQYEPTEKRLFNDTIIQHILYGVTVFLMKFKAMRRLVITMTDDKVEGIYGSLVCRTKYIDEKTEIALSKGIEQILILGSGMDTRPYRLKMSDKMKVFEVDLPLVQEFKKKKLEQYLGSLPGYVTYVPIDFNTDVLSEVLSQKQFDWQKPTFVILEGVTQYISADAARKTFDFLSTLTAGSSVVFTYILESVINKKSTIKGANELMNFFEKRSSPWQFGIDPSEIESFLKKYSLALAEDAGAGYFQEKYLNPVNRQLYVSEIERVALANLCNEQ